MHQRASFHSPDQIGLCDEIFTLGRIAIRGQNNGAILSRRSTIGINVPVNFVIVAI